MSLWQLGDEDTLNFEALPGQDDSKNIFFTLDEQNSQQALRIRFGGITGTLAADEALILLDWLGEREGILFGLLQQQEDSSDGKKGNEA